MCPKLTRIRNFNCNSLSFDLNCSLIPLQLLCLCLWKMCLYGVTLQKQ